MDEALLAERWNLIPEKLDILITHGPPQGLGDWTYEYKEDKQKTGFWNKTGRKLEVGSPSLLNAVRSKQPRIHVYGHLHDGYGQYECGKSKLFNASYVDEGYLPAHKPWIIELYSLREAAHLLNTELRSKFVNPLNPWFGVAIGNDYICVYCEKKLDLPLDYLGWPVKMVESGVPNIGGHD
jgi:hypothetical protein